MSRFRKAWPRARERERIQVEDGAPGETFSSGIFLGAAFFLLLLLYERSFLLLYGRPARLVLPGGSAGTEDVAAATG